VWFAAETFRVGVMYEQVGECRGKYSNWSLELHRDVLVEELN
jgi:hypothetical protein